MAFSSRMAGIIGGSLLLVLALALGARSCGTVDTSLAGVWHGYAPLSEVAKEDPLLARNIAGVTLTLKATGHFELIDGGLPLTGQWQRQENALTFDVETFMQRPLATQPDAAKKAVAAFTGRVDGTAIVFRGLAGIDVRLEREPPKL